MQKYLGLDLSTVSTGYAVFNEQLLVESGKIVPPEGMSVMARIVYTAGKVRTICTTHKPDKVIIEDVFYGSNYLTTKLLNRLAGAVYSTIYTYSGDLYPLPNIEFVTPTSARKYFGLLPASKKRHIVEAVNRKFGLSLKIKDNDEADAIVTGYYGYILDHQPDETYKKESQKFFKTKVRGMKTPPIKGLKK